MKFKTLMVALFSVSIGFSALAMSAAEKDQIVRSDKATIQKEKAEIDANNAAMKQAKAQGDTARYNEIKNRQTKLIAQFKQDGEKLSRDLRIQTN